MKGTLKKWRFNSVWSIRTIILHVLVICHRRSVVTIYLLGQTFLLADLCSKPFLYSITQIYLKSYNDLQTKILFCDTPQPTQCPYIIVYTQVNFKWREIRNA